MKEEKHENKDLDDLEDINNIESYLNNKKEKKYKSMFMKTFLVDFNNIHMYMCGHDYATYGQ